MSTRALQRLTHASRHGLARRLLSASASGGPEHYAQMSDGELEARLRAIVAEKQRRQSTLIIGAAGAIGKRLCAALTARGHRVVATDRMERLPQDLQGAMGGLGTCVGSVDVRDAQSLRTLFQKHADANTTVWNLAAPLSVETALDPAVAEAVTVGGMRNVLAAMSEVGAKRICFTDSIGSFGAAAPRRGATARWLTENPTQDPGSDYGRQKRACRELMAAFRRDHGGDARFAVLPGVLHTNAVWGNGTTEYALDALLTAPHQATRLGLPTSDAFVCPIDPDVRLPMIFVSDLMRGLISLQEADPAKLNEPQSGYAIPGLSFTPNELFAEIRKHHPGFGYRVSAAAPPRVVRWCAPGVRSAVLNAAVPHAPPPRTAGPAEQEHEQVRQPVARRAGHHGAAAGPGVRARGEAAGHGGHRAGGARGPQRCGRQGVQGH